VKEERRSLAVLVERRATGNVWQPVGWRILGLRAPEPDDAPGRALDEERLVAGIGDLVLHRSEAENYLFNLFCQARAAVYVVLDRPQGEGEAPKLVGLTCDPYEAEGADGPERMVEALPMPAEIEAWVQGFVADHYRETPFVKRQRKPHDPRKARRS